MTKSVFLLVCCLCAYSCASSTATLTRTAAPEAGQSPAPSAAREAPDDERYYREFCALRVSTDDKDGEGEVRVRTIKVSLDQLPQNMPYSYLEIRNPATGAQILREDVRGFPISVYTLDVNGDEKKELVTVWTAGVGQRLQIFDVGPAQARPVFDESYRLDAALVNLGGGTIDILLTSAEYGTGPFFTTRYVWRNGRYESAGTAPYKNVVTAIEQQFGGRKKSD